MSMMAVTKAGVWARRTDRAFVNYFTEIRTRIRSREMTGDMGGSGENKALFETGHRFLCGQIKAPLLLLAGETIRCPKAETLSGGGGVKKQVVADYKIYGK